VVQEDLNSKCFGHGMIGWALVTAILPVCLSAQEREPGYVVVRHGEIVAYDSSVFTDAETARLVTLARARHVNQTLQVNGYRAKVYTRMDGRVGSSRFTHGLQIFAYETAAQLQWL